MGIKNVCPLFPTRLHIKSGFDWPRDFIEEYVCLKIMVIYMYIAPGADNTIGGARWLSGRASDFGARGGGLKIYLRWVVSLRKTLYSPKEEAMAPSRHD